MVALPVSLDSLHRVKDCLSPENIKTLPIPKGIGLYAISNYEFSVGGKDVSPYCGFLHTCNLVANNSFFLLNYRSLEFFLILNFNFLS